MNYEVWNPPERVHYPSDSAYLSTEDWLVGMEDIININWHVKGYRYVIYGPDTNKNVDWNVFKK